MTLEKCQTLTKGSLVYKSVAINYVNKKPDFFLFSIICGFNDRRKRKIEKKIAPLNST